MSKKINICIPTPCHENWQDMTVADKGRFCASCQKHVIDFTTSTNRQIAEAFKKESNLCGRFLHTQLHRDLLIPKEKSSIWMAASAAVVAFIGLGNNQVYAQTPMEQVDNFTKNSRLNSSEITITGTVLDQTKMPIPGAEIKNVTKQLSISSDFDGLFSIEASKGDVIEITFIGMLTQHFEVNSDTNYSITMIDDETQFTNIPIDVYGEVVKKRTFFGRIFHSIGNIFR